MLLIRAGYLTSSTDVTELPTPNIHCWKQSSKIPILGSSPSPCVANTAFFTEDDGGERWMLFLLALKIHPSPQAKPKERAVLGERWSQESTGSAIPGLDRVPPPSPTVYGASGQVPETLCTSKWRIINRALWFYVHVWGWHEMTHGKFYKIGRTTQKLKRFFCWCCCPCTMYNITKLGDRLRVWGWSNLMSTTWLFCKPQNYTGHTSRCGELIQVTWQIPPEDCFRISFLYSSNWFLLSDTGSRSLSHKTYRPVAETTEVRKSWENQYFQYSLYWGRSGVQWNEQGIWIQTWFKFILATCQLYALATVTLDSLGLSVPSCKMGRQKETALTLQKCSKYSRQGVQLLLWSPRSSHKLLSLQRLLVWAIMSTFSSNVGNS